MSVLPPGHLTLTVGRSRQQGFEIIVCREILLIWTVVIQVPVPGEAVTFAIAPARKPMFPIPRTALAAR